MKRLFIIFLIILLVPIASIFLFCGHFADTAPPSKVDVYVGVSFGLNTTREAKLLVDKVREYTNIFVIQSSPVSTNETALNEICDYAVNAGMKFIVFFDFISHVMYPWHCPWLDAARERWGDNFLGVYLYDEPGGKQLDIGEWGRGVGAVRNASDYGDAANQFVTSIRNSGSIQDVKNRSIPVLTSDYALYWFDYLAGYDCVLAQFGWNNSRVQNIALCRGAANMQNKQWGVIITWTYLSPPYLESGAELFRDMVTAYRAGAQYIILFDYPKINPFGILTEEHFDALRKFWDYVHVFPRSIFGVANAEGALVLPMDYGWGMRNINDNIWGLWPPDNRSTQIWNEMNALISKYGLRLDIIYDDPKFNIQNKYSRLYFWNSTGQ